MTTKKDISESFIQEFIVGFGLLEGIWIHIGTNPEKELINALSLLGPTGELNLMMTLIGILVFVGTFYASFKIGRYIGLFAIFLAFLSGIFLEATFMPWLFLISLGLGYIAPILKI